MTVSESLWKWDQVGSSILDLPLLIRILCYDIGAKYGLIAEKGPKSLLLFSQLDKQYTRAGVVHFHVHFTFHLAAARWNVKWTQKSTTPAKAVLSPPHQNYPWIIVWNRFKTHEILPKSVRFHIEQHAIDVANLDEVVHVAEMNKYENCNFYLLGHWPR